MTSPALSTEETSADLSIVKAGLILALVKVQTKAWFGDKLIDWLSTAL